jgi:hypothetical protein
VQELEVPVAFCPTCDDVGPVVVDILTLEGEIVDGYGATIIYCPQCETILNSGKNVELKWYNVEDLERVTGWRLS